MQEPVTITLAGVQYLFRMPKIALLISALMQMKGKPELEQQQIMIDAQARWMARGLGKDAWADVQHRLDDEDDALDWPDIQNAFQGLQAADAGRPTMSSVGSSTPSPTTTLSADAPSQSGSTFGV